MRAPIAAVASVLLLAALAAAQEPAGISSNLLTRYLDRANIHPPVRVGGLVIFPISLSRTHPIGGWAGRGSSTSPTASCSSWPGRC